MSERQPTYLGDGVYLDDDGFQIWLAVNHHANRVVALEPSVFAALVQRGQERFRAMYGRDVEDEVPVTGPAAGGV